LIITPTLTLTPTPTLTLTLREPTSSWEGKGCVKVGAVVEEEAGLVPMVRMM
jgi:hypothetical protein